MSGDINILHLSDLHIGGATASSKSIRDNIERAVCTKEENPIDVIIVTGDIFDIIKDNKNDTLCEEKKLEIALDFFNDLSERLEIDKKNILFVPGNHDVYLDSTNEDIEPWQLYNKFLKKFYKNVSGWLKQYDLDTHMVIKKDDQRHILFLGFNSNFFETLDCGKTKYKIKIDLKQFDKITSLLNDSAFSYNNYYKIAFFHHPFYVFDEDKDYVDGLLVNAEYVLNQLAEYNIKLILHGHKHLIKLRLERLKGAMFYTIAGGTLKNGEENRSFNIIKKTDDRITVGEMNFSRSEPFGHYETILLDDFFRNNFLYRKIEKIERYKKRENEDIDKIIQMLNELYLNYDAMELFGYNDKYINDNLHFLLLSIQYRLKVREKLKEVESPESFEAKYIVNIDNSNILEKMRPDLLPVLKIIRNYPLHINEVIDKNTKNELEQFPEKKIHYAFALVASFFTDIYWDFTKDWDKCFRKNLDSRRKETESIPKVRLSGRGINYDHRHIYIRFESESQEAQKCAEMLIKAYKNELNFLNEYFYCIKLPVLNIIPEIIGNRNKKYCDFDASIPRLIPLLTGDNIYSSEFVFARELIQNSIDAIAFREELDKSWDSLKDDYKKISIEMGFDKNQKYYFQIADAGIGMRQEVIELYFTTLGRSYYKEYNDMTTEKKEYNSISNFGIGFLSVFKLCNNINVKTQFYDSVVCYNLEIENDHDYFLMTNEERSKEYAGTTITCYFENQEDIIKKSDQLFSYLKEIMLDIKYDIILKVDGHVNKISARNVRKIGDNRVIFIPFDEKHKEVGRIDDYSMHLDSYLSGIYKHGLIIRPLSDLDVNNERGGVKILNAGVLMKNSELADILNLKEQCKSIKLKYIEVIINFPPNWLFIDVSREKANKFNENYFNVDTFREKVFQSFSEQLKRYITNVNNQDISLAVIAEMMDFMGRIFSDKEDFSAEYLGKIKLNITFKPEKQSLEFGITKRENGFHHNKIYYDYEKFDDASIKKSVYKTLYQRFHNVLQQEGVYESIGKYIRNSDSEKRDDFLQRIGINGLKEKHNFPIVLMSCLNPEIVKKYEDVRDKYLVEQINDLTAEVLLVGDINEGKLFSVNYDNEEDNRIKDNSPKLEERIKNIAAISLYNADPDIDKYDFIWNYIIKKDYDVFFNAYNNRTNWEKIREIGQKKYEFLRDENKDLYGKSPKYRVDIYTIAACYMGSLFEIQIDFISEKEEISKKYEWILNVGLDLVYMWELSGYKEENQDLYNKYLEKKIVFPEHIKNRYINLLALLDAYQKKFDTLYFAEILFWIALYNNKI